MSQPLNNPPVLRWVSDQLDKVLIPGNPVREYLHGVEHTAACVLTGNQRECQRALDKFQVDGRADHLKTYDFLQQHKYQINDYSGSKFA